MQIMFPQSMPHRVGNLFQASLHKNATNWAVCNQGKLQQFICQIQSRGVFFFFFFLGYLGNRL